MPRRWIVPWKDSVVKPVIYHCLSRVVDKRMAFGSDEKEKFRALMRMTEKFSGCRILTYCVMSNHFHLLLEVPPMPVAGLTDEELLRRLQAIYSEAFVAEVARELAEARQQVADGLALETAVVGRIHARFTHRMHDLSEFMKTLIQRFTIWFNRSHQRSGNLWEDAFKSVVVEDGVAARTMAAYIDLNPVRAGICEDPAAYRWSGYGEAMGGSAVGSGQSGQKARAGLVRAWLAHEGTPADAGLWASQVATPYRMTLMEGAVEKTAKTVTTNGEETEKSLRKGMSRATANGEIASLPGGGGLGFGQMLRCRLRYFSAGGVIGSKAFVNEFFQATRQRFGPKRKDGARKLRGAASAAAGQIWSLRALAIPDRRTGTAGGPSES
jgi:REP element-mobilizing transposase RayT